MAVSKVEKIAIKVPGHTLELAPEQVRELRVEWAEWAENGFDAIHRYGTYPQAYKVYCKG